MLRVETDCVDRESTEVTFLFAERKMHVYILNRADSTKHAGNAESFLNGLHETL